jgi:hypothetical protein
MLATVEVRAQSGREQEEQRPAASTGQVQDGERARPKPRRVITDDDIRRRDTPSAVESAPVASQAKARAESYGSGAQQRAKVAELNAEEESLVNLLRTAEEKLANETSEAHRQALQGIVRNYRRSLERVRRERSEGAKSVVR